MITAYMVKTSILPTIVEVMSWKVKYLMALTRAFILGYSNRTYRIFIYMTTVIMILFSILNVLYVFIYLWCCINLCLIILMWFIVNLASVSHSCRGKYYWQLQSVPTISRPYVNSLRHLQQSRCCSGQSRCCSGWWELCFAFPDLHREFYKSSIFKSGWQKLSMLGRTSLFSIPIGSMFRRVCSILLPWF